MSVEWYQVLVTVGVTIVLALVGGIWIMLKERITLLREDTNRRLQDMEHQHEAEHRKLDKEIETLRKARHNLVDRLSAVETFLKYFVVQRRPGTVNRQEDEDDSPNL